MVKNIFNAPGNVSASALRNIPVSTATPTSNDFLSYNGTQWIPSNVVSNIGGSGNDPVTVNGNGLEFTNSTTGYVPYALKYYEKNASVSIDFSGAFTSTGNLFVFTRIGNIVLCRMPSIFGDVTTGTTLNAAAGSIPARFRPVVQQRTQTIGRDLGSTPADMVTIDWNTDGSVTVNKNASDVDFTVGESGGVWGTMFLWECSS